MSCKLRKYLRLSVNTGMTFPAMIFAHATREAGG
jgi:hypothetical protein